MNTTFSLYKSNNSAQRSRQGQAMAHIIVVGNEKGGAGKSTVSMHVATALARLGYRVGALDLDLRQKTFARYLENRRDFMKRSGLSLPWRPARTPSTVAFRWPWRSSRPTATSS
jgi:Mrp family chromosome partitioning ATPase